MVGVHRDINSASLCAPGYGDRLNSDIPLSDPMCYSKVPN